ncbi:hypothetical protein CO657_18365 [Rhizobium acidisoli]|uniref:Uncharacterized protein n=1 Tax=Rhizobium acidisoli TaxID=1538158 RepID=A0AAE5WNN9_9HYPH|nr:hypothetical protein [Rhizobium acidisoli]KPH09371.1 hypothetical protein AOG23_08895 [Rhizobium acidisoli]QAS79910.1 hypothetical protein CO657_18365 [Rhizobium acidisoli]
MANCTHPEFTEDRSREQRLSVLLPGDIFHADDDERCIPLTCIVVGLDDDTIFARRLTTQENLTFDRRTGEISGSDAGYRGAITSIEPLPADNHATLIGLDRRYRLASRSTDNTKLTQAEKDTLLFLPGHYESHPIDERTPAYERSEPTTSVDLILKTFETGFSQPDR